MNDGTIKFQVIVDSKAAEANITTLSQKATNLSSSFKNAGKTMTMGLTLPIVGAGVASVKFASDLEETLNKVDVSFGDSAESVKKWAKTSIKSMGLAQQTALDSAALFGDMGTGMGIAEDSAADMAMELTQLSADLASFKNVRQDVAETALKGVFTGETESLKGLGIVMTEANLAEFALSKGITTRISDMTQAQKVQLRYKFVMEKTSKAQGDFVRTSDGMANQTRMVGEQLKELSTQMGVILLPIALKLIKGVSSLVSWFSSLTEGQKKTILTILGIVAALGPLLMIFGQIASSVVALDKAYKILSANPLLLQIGLLIAALAVLYDSYKKVSGAVKELNDLSEKNASQSQQNIETTKEATKGATTQKQKDYLINLYGTQLQRAVNAMKDKENEIAKAKKNPLTYWLVKDSLNSSLKNYQNEASTLRKEITKLGGTPKLATGTNNVQKDGLAYLHQGEAVVPKKYNPAMGGGQTILIEMGDVIMDGKSVGRIVTPYVTKTIKVGGGNV